MKFGAYIYEICLSRHYAYSRNFQAIPDKLREISNFETRRQGDNLDRLKSYKIVVTTVVNAGRLVSFNIPKGHFAHIFIDEAGHAMEPEAVIPLGIIKRLFFLIYSILWGILFNYIIVCDRSVSL